jgi:S1-C subfamily serine protease
VEPGSVADEAGLQRGDIVLEVNRASIGDETAFAKAVAKAKGKKSILFLVRRGDNTIFVALKPPSE